MSTSEHRGSRNFRGSSTRPSASSRGRDILTGLENTSIETLEKSEADLDGEDITIKHFAYIGSYNWVEAKHPTIIVPGSPPKWLDVPLPITVKPDSGTNFIDQNGFRMGKQPLLPLIQAVETMSTDHSRQKVDWPSVDFVTDRNGLRKLLRWVTASSAATGKSNDFRIDTQLAGDKTVLLSRWEKVTKERGGNAGQSYGFNFEKAATAAASGCEAATGHHRIITYDFDGLKLVIRFEVDAYLPQNPCAPSVSHSQPGVDAEGDSLADSIGNLSIGSPSLSTHSRQTVGSQLNVIRAGSEVPQSSLIEMKTRTPNSITKLKLGKEFPQLYFSQTPYHYVALHENGKFTLVRKDEVGQGALADSEEGIQVGLKKLRAVLATIQELVRGRGLAGRLTLICAGGVLKVYERTSNESCLPSDLLALFYRKS